MTTYQIQKVGRIDQVVRDFFKKNPTVREVMAKDLMPLFIENIFEGPQKWFAHKKYTSNA